MLDAIFAALKAETSLSQMTTILCTISDLIEAIAEEHLKDPSIKNDVIDAVINILQQHKS